MRFALMLPLSAVVLAGCGPKTLELPADPVEKAATCSVVAAASARKGSNNMGALSFDQQARLIHYALLGAGDGGKFDQARAQAVTLKAQEISETVTGGKWQELVQPCEAAYPQATATGPVTLPASDFDARLACYQLGAFLAKAMQGGDQAVEDKLVQFGGLNRDLDQKIGAGFAAKGVKTDTDQAKAMRDEALGEAAKLGPPGAVMQACMDKYGKK